jgi:hypothetical protein
MFFNKALNAPEDHLSLFHDNQKETVILWSSCSDDRKWHALTTKNKSTVKIAELNNLLDVFITPNEFHGWRRLDLLSQLNAQFIDLDAHNNEDVLELVERAGWALIAAKVPEPSVIVWTGRGAHFYWLIKPTPASALPRWQAVQRQLIKITGADRMCADATRLMRLIGSINSKTGKRVTGEFTNPNRFDFDWLAEQVLPVGRDKIRITRKNNTSKNHEIKEIRPTYGSIYDRWHLVYVDILKIVEWHWGSGCVVPADSKNRNTIIFHLVNALSWNTKVETLQNEITLIARRMTPSLSEENALSYTSSIIRRAKKTADDGDESRYKFKRSTLYENLAHLIPDALLPELRAIIPDSLARQRKQARDQLRRSQKRIEAGAQPRNEYLTHCNIRRSKACKLFDEGMTTKMIAQHLGVSIRSVQSWIRQ